MRWVFYSLLVVNLVYLGWQLASDAVWGAGPSPLTERADAGESSDAPALRLLSEAPQPDRARPAAGPEAEAPPDRRGRLHGGRQRAQPAQPKKAN